MPQTRDIGVDQAKEEQVLYYFLAPDGVVYGNPDNHPAESLAKALKQQGLYLRFAYNKDLNLLFLQDQSEIQPRVNEQDPGVMTPINRVVSWIQETFDAPYPKLGNGTGYGEPPASCQARKLSDFQVVWQYLSKFLAAEFKGTRMEEFSTPVDINVAEYYEEREEGDRDYVKSFHPDGLTFLNKTFHGPTLLVNKAPEQKGQPIDFGIMSLYIASWYLMHFEEISNAVLSAAERAYLRMSFRNLRINDFGYDVFYVGYNPHNGDTPVYSFATKTTETIDEGHARRDLSNKIAENLKKNDQPVPEGELYTAPIVVFSYLPYRKQIVWQSMDPSINSDPIYAKMCANARKQIISWYGDNPEEMTESHDPSAHLPNLAKMSHYYVAWEYITDIMAPRYGFDPEKYDIEVLECPKPVGDAIAVYFSTAQDEEDKGSAVRDMRISYGITVKFPFIAQNSLNNDYGLSLNALIHEYEHYINDVFKKKKEYIPFQSFNERGISEDERTRRFFSYIASQKEHDAHLEQMVYMLHMGMTDRDIIDTFAPMEMMAWRAEYRLILGEAKEIYKADRSKRKVPQQYVTPRPAKPSEPDPEGALTRAEEPEESQAPKEVAMDVEASVGKPVRTSELDVGVNDWFWEGLQEVVNRPRQVNRKDPAKDDTFNLSRLRHQPHVEQALEDDRDKDGGYLKSLEQLLRENQL